MREAGLNANGKMKGDNDMVLRYEGITGFTVGADLCDRCIETIGKHGHEPEGKES